MAKLTKAQRTLLRQVLNHAERAERYIADARTAVCMRDSQATTTLHYTRADGAVLYEVAKEYGSDLCGLNTATRQLAAFLVEN